MFECVIAGHFIRGSYTVMLVLSTSPGHDSVLKERTIVYVEIRTGSNRCVKVRFKLSYTIVSKYDDDDKPG